MAKAQEKVPLGRLGTPLAGPMTLSLLPPPRRWSSTPRPRSPSRGRWEHPCLEKCWKSKWKLAQRCVHCPVFDMRVINQCRDDKLERRHMESGWDGATIKPEPLMAPYLTLECLTRLLNPPWTVCAHLRWRRVSRCVSCPPWRWRRWSTPRWPAQWRRSMSQPTPPWRAMTWSWKSRSRAGGRTDGGEERAAAVAGARQSVWGF